MTTSPTWSPPAPPAGDWSPPSPPPGAWGPPENPSLPPESPAGRRSRPWGWIAIGAGGAVAVIFVILMVVGYILASSTTLLSSNFDSGKGPFVAESDSNVTLSYVDGGYSTRLNAGSPPQVARAWFEYGSVHGLRVTIDATVRSSSEDFAWGIGTWNGGSAQYMLLTSSQGGAALDKEGDARTGNRTLLTTSERPATTEQAHFVLEIQPATQGPTQISGSVSGQAVQASDVNGFHSFSGVGLWVSDTDQPVDILWDNLKVTRLGD